MLDQPKIDLAVLLKLFQHAENDGDAESVEGVRNLFDIDISKNRVLAALEGLESRGEVTRGHDRYAADETVWRINRDGIRRVENALRAPNSFIARLHSGGDGWLTGEDAAKAKLNRIKRPSATDPAIMFHDDAGMGSVAQTANQSTPVQITNNFSPSNTNTLGSGEKGSSSSVAAWIGVLVAVLGVAVTIWLSGKI